MNADKPESTPEKIAGKMPLKRLVSTKHPDLIRWEKMHKCQLFIGSKVTVEPTAEYYEEQYDKGRVFMVASMYVDSVGLNLCLNDGETDNYSCDMDGYYINDVSPA